MRIKNIVPKGIFKTLVLPISIPAFDTVVWSYVPGQTKTILPVSSSVKGNFRYVTFQTPSFDCYLIIKYGEGGEFMRVGQPPMCLLVKYDSTANTIPYEQYNYNSVLIRSGSLFNIGNGFYAAINVQTVESFYVVNDVLITATLDGEYTISTSSTSGIIRLNRGRWQLIAIPSKGKVLDSFLEKLELQTGIPYGELVNKCLAYPGSVDKFLTFIPGFTDPTSEHNFDLKYDDGGNLEITAFWVECKKWTHTTEDIDFSWKDI